MFARGSSLEESPPAFSISLSFGVLLGSLWSLAWQFLLYFGSLAEAEPDLVRLGCMHVTPLIASLVVLRLGGRNELLRGLADGVIVGVVVLDLAAALIWLGSA